MTRIAVLCTALLVTTILLGTSAHARNRSADGGVVLVNGTSSSGNVATYEKLRRILDTNDLLVRLSTPMQTLMDGRRLAIEDLESIRDAYAKLEYETALLIIDQNQKRILGSAGGGDPLRPLAALQLWRGLLAIADGDEPKAVEFFRAALRFDPTVSPDANFRKAPTVQKILRLALKEPSTTGKLEIELEGEAKVSINGGEAQPVGKKITLVTGLHIVSILQEGMKPYLEIVNIVDGETETIAPDLDEETDEDRAARLVDDAANAPPGKARLKKANEVAQLIGRKKFLYIEDMSDGHAKVRVYDVSTARISNTVDLDLDATDTQIRRRIIAAINPENMIPVQEVVLVDKRGREKKWYQKWYVWVGAAALVGGGALGVHYMTRDPVSAMGF